jgi:hypothetical protein
LNALVETQSIVLDSREKRIPVGFERLLLTEMAAKLLELDAESWKGHDCGKVHKEVAAQQS